MKSGKRKREKNSLAFLYLYILFGFLTYFSTNDK